MINRTIFSLLVLSLLPYLAHANVSYCDSSAGRMVSNKGGYSQTYCTQTAVMDLQNIHDCCTWQGGVMLVKRGLIICRDSSISQVCSIQLGQQQKEHPFQKNIGW